MLYGREAERARVDALLAGALASRSGALVVRGAAGIGKSSLLDDAASRTAMPVLRATGIESESELAFAGLHQLLLPVLDHADRLQGVQSDVLERAFGLRAGEVDDRFRVSVAALGLLAEVADDEGLLCVVDDAQWLDEPTAESLLFVARRLEAEGIVLLFAAREADVRRFDAPGLPELWLGGLDGGSATALLGDGMSEAVRDQLLAVAEGNPLALVELPASLSREQLAGREPLIDPLPVGRGVERAFQGRISALGEHARRFLLLVAADDASELAPVLRAAELLGIDVTALDDLEAAELLHVDGTSIRFRHPLVRSSVYRGAGFTQREGVHHALAAVLDPERDADRRAWHRAAASPGPDAEVADELEQSALRARLRGGHAAAATALERAARLSCEDAACGRRLLAAAEANWTGGRPHRCGPLLEQAERVLEDDDARIRVALLRGSYELERGRPADAYRLFLTAAAEVQEADPRAALEMLVRAGEASSVSGHKEWAQELAAIAADVPGGAHDEELFMVALLEGVARLIWGDVDAGVPALEHARELSGAFDHPRYLAFAAMADMHLGDFVSAHARRARAVALLRSSGAVGELPLALVLLAASEVWMGRYTSAAANGAEGLRLAEGTGQDTHVAWQLAILALAAAARGEEAECRRRAADAIELAIARGLSLPGSLGAFALGRLELGLGRPEIALGHLALIRDPASGLESWITAHYAAGDHVEAAVRAGRPELAVPVLEDFAPWAERVPPRWPAAVAARSRALLASGAGAEAHFAEALRIPADAETPFEHARSELLFGEALRRGRRRTEARTHLRAALAAFQRLGATPWAERASGELRATGETARRREPSTIDQLTPQEMQIARFVSEGASNREVASKLFLSPRTVEYHLHKVFTKLGIASRGELAGILPRLDGAAQPVS